MTAWPWCGGSSKARRSRSTWPPARPRPSTTPTRPPCPPGQTELRVTGRGGGRLFVSVRPTAPGPGRGGGPAGAVRGDPELPRPGWVPRPDLGEAVRWGLVFRAERSTGCRPATSPCTGSWACVSSTTGRRHGSGTSCPTPSPPGAHDHRPAGRHRTGLATGPRPGLRRRTARPLPPPDVPRTARHSAGQIGELYTGLAAGGGLPAVFHCHGGKDRTGIVAALLLSPGRRARRSSTTTSSPLGYRRREHHESTFGHARVRLDPPAAAGVLSRHPGGRWPRRLDDLDRQGGGIETYLTVAGVAAADLQVLERVVGPRLTFQVLNPVGARRGCCPPDR